MTTRREFLRSLAVAASMAGVAGAPKFSFAQSTGGKTFIKVFARGGADGLHLFPKVNDTAYYDYRPQLAIEAPDGEDENTARSLGSSVRAMNPNLEALLEIWNDGRMMVAPSTSFEGANGSHFDCQRWIGTGARNNLIDGYLNRYLQEVSGENHPVRGAVLGKSSGSTETRGRLPLPVINSGDSFDLETYLFCEGSDCEDNRLTEMMRQISSHDVDVSAVEESIRETQLLMLNTIDEVQQAGLDYTPSQATEGVDYSNSSLGKGLKLCAQLIKAGVPLEVAALDWNIGWDTHSNQIPNGNEANRFYGNSRYNDRIAEGAQDMLTFYRDMGAAMNDVVVLVGSEFGRTKRQNGSFGTDHGRGGAWWAFGGPVRRQIAEDVDSIDDAVIGRENRLPTVTSYRDIVGEIMVRHMGMNENLVSTIFPGHSFVDLRLLAGTS
ncbi:MAG: DUF1501 domain-containing protein [Pseudomonadota bacterium]